MAKKEAPKRTGKGRMGELKRAASAFAAFRPAREVLRAVSSVGTRFPQFDYASRVGGLPIERFMVVHGPSNEGKSLFALGLIGSFLERGHMAMLIDAERCYDSETEVLTRRGFIAWPQVREDDLIGCWDPEQQSLVYEKPFELTRQTYKGPMYRVDHGGVDLLVTPKHKMFVQTPTDRGRSRGEREIGWSEWKMVHADELGDRTSVRYRKHAVRTAVADLDLTDGTKAPIFPPHDDHRALLRMIGFFIGDGWVGEKRGRTNALSFGLTKPRKVAYLREVAAELGWQVDDMAHNVYVVRAEGVGRIFRSQFYDANKEKTIPEYLLDLNAADAEAMLDGLRASDGSLKRGAWEYFTTSDQVATAVQRLVIHAGGSAHIHSTDIMNRVMVLSRMLEPIINNPSGGNGGKGSNTSLVEYDGEIFCAHTRTGIMMVRRKGKPVLSGNTTPITWVREMIGAKADSDHFIAMRPATYEDTVAAVRKFVTALKSERDAGRVHEDTSALIVVDSIRKLVPKGIFDKIAKEGADAKGIDGMGGRAAQIKAAMNSQWMDELVPLLEDTRTAMVVIARETDDAEADMWAKKAGRDFKVGGGKALYYDASMVMRVQRDIYITEKFGEGDKQTAKVYGERHRITVTKTKVAGREVKQTTCYFHTSNGVYTPLGFEPARDLLELGEKLGVVAKAGSWYSFDGEKIGNGGHQTVKHLSENPDLLQRIEVAVRGAFVTKEPTEHDEDGVIE